MSESKSIKKPSLSPTQAKVVKAKIKAELTDTPVYKVAQEVFPHQTPAAANTSMHRELQKATVQDALQIALAEHDLTTDRLAGVVDEAMSATKTVIIRDKGATGEAGDNSAFADEVPDHAIRLKAAGMAAQWMGIGKQTEGGTTNLNFINMSQSDQNDYAI